MAVSMFAIMLIPFVFTLLALLLVKAPKVGGWLVAGLILVAPLVLLRMWNVPGHRGGMALGPLLIIFSVFFVVLLVLLFAKAPKVGAGVIVALVLMALLALGLFFVPIASHRRVEYVERPSPIAPAVLHSPHESIGASPIWSEGMDVEFDADIYPSQAAAVRALGARIQEPLKQAIADINTPAEIVIFQEDNQRSLVSIFERAIRMGLPDIPCSVEAGLRNIRSGEGEVGLTLRREVTTREVPQERGTGLTVLRPFEAGQLVAKVFGVDRRASVEVSYIEKPWVEDFASFANESADRQFLVARSQSACTFEYQARRQAMQDACRQVALMVRDQGRAPRWGSWSVNPSDVEETGLVIDQFVQSFDGSTGDIWRQAVLLDVSRPQLRRLETRMNHLARAAQMSWARMGFSVIGVLGLIGVIYFFLNMATRGYYEWSLRIAGVILAIVAVISVLMMVQ